MFSFPPLSRRCFVCGPGSDVYIVINCRKKMMFEEKFTFSNHFDIDKRVLEEYKRKFETAMRYLVFVWAVPWFGLWCSRSTAIRVVSTKMYPCDTLITNMSPRHAFHLPVIP